MDRDSVHSAPVVGVGLARVARLAISSAVSARLKMPTPPIQPVNPTLREMEDMAWVLRTDGHRRSIGFVQARELKPGLRYVLSDDWD